MSIDWYDHLQLPSDGPAAATACLNVEPSRPPGSSCEFYSAANRLSLTAQTFRDALSKLDATAAADSWWSGDAAAAFRKLLKDPHRSHLDQVPDRYDGYASSLRAYASTLDDHQARIASARAGVQSALDAYHGAVAATPGPRQPTSFMGMPLPDTDSRHGPAVQECVSAARQFRAVYNDWVDAARRCQRNIKTVDTDKLHNPHGGSAATSAVTGAVKFAVDHLASLAGEVAGLSSVLALVSIVLCPELTVVFLEVAMTASQVKLAADSARKGIWHEKVTLGDLAFDALGAVPVGRTAEAMTSAKQAVREAKGLKAGIAKFTKCFGLLSKHGREVAGNALTGLRDNGGLAESVSRTSWSRTGTAVKDNLRDNRQDMLAYPAEYGRNASDNRHKGWAQALGWSAFRVHWQSLAPLDQLDRSAHSRLLGAPAWATRP